MSRVAGITRGGDEQKQPINCPKCGAAMGKVTFASIVVDRCTSCRGLWFDAREHERLKDLEGSEEIDAPPPRGASAPGAAPSGGTKPDDPKMNCPVCHTRLIRMVDHRQPHIHFESCTVCHGTFFDAGEFRDYKEHAVGEWFRSRTRR
jgi:Zn-finger nucleic acid-binding protein